MVAPGVATPSWLGDTGGGAGGGKVAVMVTLGVTPTALSWSCHGDTNGDTKIIVMVTPTTLSWSCRGDTNGDTNGIVMVTPTALSWSRLGDPNGIVITRSW